MSAAPRLSADMVGRRMAAEEYLSCGETPERTELIDGIVVMSPSPTPLHWKVIYTILRQLGAWSDTAPGAEVFCDTDVVFGTGLVYRPDLCVYAPGRLQGIPPRLASPPDLIVEVLSPGGRALDLITKRDDYGRLGVGEYWVVDPETAEVRCWRRAGEGAFAEASPDGDALRCAALDGFILDLEALRAVAPRRM